MSLDGCIAGPNGEIDWLPTDVGLDWAAFMARFDTILMGRHTFELTRSMGEAGSRSMRTFVFSRTLRAADHPAVTMVSDDAAAVVTALRQEEGREIWLMGGGILCASLMDAGLVDAVEVGIVPILLGRGIPFMPALAGATPLRLAGSQQYDGGLLLLDYEVERTQSH
jgi:dihydrofolate reductase